MSGTVTYTLDEMEHILNCFDNLFYIDSFHEKDRENALTTIHKACHEARQKWCEAVKEQTEK